MHLLVICNICLAFIFVCEKNGKWARGANDQAVCQLRKAISARALTVAAASGDPPRLPRMTILGTFFSSSSNSLDSAALTKPTGMPIISAGGLPPARMCLMSVMRVVGALPTARMLFSIRSPAISIAAWDNVVPCCLARSLTPGRESRQLAVTPRGSRRRLGIPARTIWVSVNT